MTHNVFGGTLNLAQEQLQWKCVFSDFSNYITLLETDGRNPSQSVIPYEINKINNISSYPSHNALIVTQQTLMQHNSV